MTPMASGMNTNHEKAIPVCEGIQSGMSVLHTVSYDTDLAKPRANETRPDLHDQIHCKCIVSLHHTPHIVRFSLFYRSLRPMCFYTSYFLSLSFVDIYWLLGCLYHVVMHDTIGIIGCGVVCSVFQHAKTIWIKGCANKIYYLITSSYRKLQEIFDHIAQMKCKGTMSAGTSN